MTIDLSKFINATEAGERLSITRVRVVQLINEKRLPAFKAGRDWLIDPADLALVADRKPGRPRSGRTSAVDAEEVKTITYLKKQTKKTRK